MINLILFLSLSMAASAQSTFSFWHALLGGTCPAAQHKEAGVCQPDIRSCPISNGGGTQSWVYSNRTYTSCAISYCNGGYHVESGSCQPDVRSCGVANGYGNQYWNGSGYNGCIMAGCYGGYYPYGGVCQAMACVQVPENTAQYLSCPVGIIRDIIFASYGTPDGSCGGYSYGWCHSAVSVDIIRYNCIGQQSCLITATNRSLGEPCDGTYKRAYVQAVCF